MAVDNTGRLWVTDSANDQVHLYSADGEFVRTIGSRGTGPGRIYGSARHRRRRRRPHLRRRQRQSARSRSSLRTENTWTPSARKAPIPANFERLAGGRQPRRRGAGIRIRTIHASSFFPKTAFFSMRSTSARRLTVWPSTPRAGSTPLTGNSSKSSNGPAPASCFGHSPASSRA